MTGADDGELLARMARGSAADVRAALIIAGVRFDEPDLDGAGCAGPQLAVLRFTDGADLDVRVRAALASS